MAMTPQHRADLAAAEALPEPDTLWRARDGRLMRLDHWRADRAKPTAFMVVINPGYRMRRYSEQALDSFGGFLQPETEAP